jgi:hypothetical protein
MRRNSSNTFVGLVAQEGYPRSRRLAIWGCRSNLARPFSTPAKRGFLVYMTSGTRKGPIILVHGTWGPGFFARKPPSDASAKRLSPEKVRWFEDLHSYREPETHEYAGRDNCRKRNCGTDDEACRRELADQHWEPVSGRRFTWGPPEIRTLAKNPT